MKNPLPLFYLILLLGGQATARKSAETRPLLPENQHSSAPTQLPLPTQIVHITTGSVWKYLVASSAPAPAWKTDLAFNDTSTPWQAGKSPLGYGPQGEGTASDRDIVLQGGTCVDQCVSITPPSCKTCTVKEITTYFRKTFTISGVAGSSFAMQYQRDDGIVIYVNGVERVRENLPANTAITHSSTATAIPTDAEEMVWKSVPVVAEWLREGQNLIAVEVHQNSAGSSDIRFNLELRYRTMAFERGPYLQRYSDDSTLAIAPNKRSMTIRWSTSVAAEGRVIYKSANGGNPVTSPWKASTPLVFSDTSTRKPIHNVSVTLNSLEPDTQYSYTIQSGTLMQGDNTNFFRTAPLLGSSKKTRVWVLGDFGKNPDASGKPDAGQVKVRDAFNKYMQAGTTDKYVDLWLWLGDNAYDLGRDWEYQRSVFDVYDGRKDSSQQIMRQTPFFATPGNHDYYNNEKPAYRSNHAWNHYYDVVNYMTTGEAAGEHSKHEEYYSFDHGNIHFVSLDTYGYEKNQTTVFPAGSEQLKWLHRDLALAQASPHIKWIVVFFHHPPYTITTGSHNSDTEPELINIRQRLVKDVLDKYKVDLVLSGHSHNYQRSLPIQGHYGLEQEYKDNPGGFRAPMAANASSTGSYSCITPMPPSAPLSSSSSLGSSFIYNKSSSAKNYTVYAVNGSGGGSEGQGGPQWPHDAMHGFFYEGGSMYLEVEGNRLDGKFIDAEGVVKDQFKIIKHGDTFTIPATDGTVRRANCECTDAEGYTHYVENTAAGSANLLLSIKKNGNSIGTVGDNTFDLKLQGKKGSTLLFSGTNTTDYVRSTINVMNRYWTLKPTREIPAGNPVSIRQYWKKGVDFSTFSNVFYGPYQVMYDYSYEATIINDDGGQPVGYERNPALVSPSPHYAIPKAASYTANGAWVYKYALTASPSTFKFGVLSRAATLPGYMQAFGAEYSEFVVGRLNSIGGTMSGAFSPYSRGNGRIAAPESDAENVAVYPNPILNGIAYFRPTLSYWSFTLTNMEGRVLRRDNQPGSIDELDVSVFPAGVYILTVQTEAGTRSFKLSKP